MQTKVQIKQRNVYMEIILTGKKSIYEEIKDTVERYITLGVIKEGERLPSVRTLGMKLGVNPNTVARAYYALEDEGILRSIPKKGVFACGPKKHDPVREEARSQLILYRDAGLSKADVLALIEDVYQER